MERYLSISEMAKIHNITRQTLIHYDRIGLFIPKQVDENGYRYYSSYQIPFLREICFLKSAGIKLEDIKNHIQNRDLTTAISLLEYHQEFINKAIHKLSTTRKAIENRLHIYESVSQFKEDLSKPLIEEFPLRKVVFFPYKNPLQKQELHLRIMQALNALAKYGILPTAGFGTIIRERSLKKDSFLEGAGAFVTISINDPDIDNVMIIPAGKYVCMYKYGMPYDTHFLRSLLEWIHANHYLVIGDILDACILDTTFYDESTAVDFCQLQVPVKKIRKT